MHLPEPIVGILEAPGVTYRVTGGGDLIATTIAVTVRHDAVDQLAARFQCAPDPLVVLGEIVDGMREIFGSEAVSVRKII